jgi:hypothetical protein
MTTRTKFIKPVGDIAQLVQAIAVYREAIESGRYNQSEDFHRQVLKDATATLLSPIDPAKVKHALAEVCSEMVIMCMSPTMKWTGSVSYATARRKANFLLWGEHSAPAGRAAKC